MSFVKSQHLDFFKCFSLEYESPLLQWKKNSLPYRVIYVLVYLLLPFTAGMEETFFLQFLEKQ